jgi:hypothetical protein
MTASTTITALGPLDQLDASLDDFAPSIGHNNQNSRRLPFGYPSTHSGFRSDDLSETGDSDSEASAGGYSPPAWRRLGNGDRSSGFWRKADDLAMMYDGDDDDGFDGPRSRESSPEYESADEGDEVLAQAIRTRLPTGSLSPEKERSPEPEFHPAQQHLIDEVVHIKREHDGALALSDMKDGRLAPKDVSDNCRSDLVTPSYVSPWLISYQLFALPSGQKSSSEPSPSSRPSISSARGSAS